MKKQFLILALTASAVQVMAGGVITNTNQSAPFVRTVSRNASMDNDAVYFNPAATAQLSDGIHLSYGHQVCFQTRTTTDDFPTLNTHEYEGKIMVPAFPTLDAIWKKNNLAISLGFGPNGGGGNAQYENGLASFERQISLIPGMVSQMGSAYGLSVSDYDVNIEFKGGSVLYGGQLGVAYSFMDDKLAASIGARYIYQKNTYKGSIKDIQLNPTAAAFGMNGTMMPATTFFTNVSAALATVNPTVSAITAAYANSVADKEVDVIQTGMGFTPIIGLSFKPDDRFNFGFKYEMNTKIELTNDTKKDDIGMFTDDSTFRKDIPAIMAVGAGVKITDKLRGSLSYTMYFDKNADWEGREKFMDKNTMDIAGNLEYDIVDLLTVSAGYSRSISGVTPEFQSDMDYALSSNAYGMGGRLNFSEKLNVDLGFMYVAYDKTEKTSTYTGISHTETYDRVNKCFTLGLNYTL